MCRRRSCLELRCPQSSPLLRNTCLVFSAVQDFTSDCGTQNVSTGTLVSARAFLAGSLILVQCGFRWIFTAGNHGNASATISEFSQQFCWKGPPDKPFAKTARRGCTIFGHRLVDGVHSIEKTRTYKAVFFVDSKNRRTYNKIVL